jgi:outer membrane protein OmpA-like peptidoglycan-associated protein
MRLKNLLIVKVALILVLLLSFSQTIIAQENLLLNGGFEELALVDLKNTVIDGQIVKFENSKDTSRFWSLLSQEKRKSPVSAKYWNFSQDSFSYSNPTYFSNTGQSYKGNVFGLITPFWQVSKNKYYISNLVGQICQPLKRGNIYEFSFWIRPYRGNYYIDEINIHFSDTIVYQIGYVTFKKDKNKKQSLSPLTNLDSHCTIKLEPAYKEDYYKVKCRYKAKGGEIYVYIGNLNSNYPKKYKKKNLKHYGLDRRRFSIPVCKYIIDEVILTSLSDKNESCYKMEMDTVNTVQQIDEPIQISSSTEKEDDLIIVSFNTNNYQLEEEERTNLIAELKIIDAKEIETIFITGHTDDIGSFEKNLELSIDRAKEIEKIIRLLLSSKLEELPPITTIGKSSSEPITFEQTEFGRSENRRVEVWIKY